MEPITRHSLIEEVIAGKIDVSQQPLLKLIKTCQHPEMQRMLDLTVSLV